MGRGRGRRHEGAQDARANETLRGHPPGKPHTAPGPLPGRAAARGAQTPRRSPARSRFRSPCPALGGRPGSGPQAPAAPARARQTPAAPRAAALPARAPPPPGFCPAGLRERGGRGRAQAALGLVGGKPRLLAPRAQAPPTPPEPLVATAGAAPGRPCVSRKGKLRPRGGIQLAQDHVAGQWPPSLASRKKSRPHFNQSFQRPL